MRANELITFVSECLYPWAILPQRDSVVNGNVTVWSSVRECDSVVKVGSSFNQCDSVVKVWSSFRQCDSVVKNHHQRSVACDNAMQRAKNISNMDRELRKCTYVSQSWKL